MRITSKMIATDQPISSRPLSAVIGPVTSLNGLLLIGWSVAIIFEVMRMAEVQFARLDDRDES